MEKAIEIRNLKVSFITNNGTVKAVRDISFSLNKGETLAIVGESGSGKSVTAKSIMGIQAGNSITESGEIFFDGHDLVKISEETFHKIRGNKISMIFQDPFSSLSPIVRIGTQLTEAMLLNSKLNRKNAKREFQNRFKLIEPYFTKAEIIKKIFLDYSVQLKNYNTALEYMEIVITAADGVLISLARRESKVVVKEIDNILKVSDKCIHDLLINETEYKGLITSLRTAAANYKSSNDSSGIKEVLGKIKDCLSKALKTPKFDFFTDCFKKEIKEDLFDKFLDEISEALKFYRDVSLKKKQVFVDLANQKIPLFETDTATVNDYKAALVELKKAIKESINPLAVSKDNFAYAFHIGCDTTLKAYTKTHKQLNRDTTAKARLDGFRDNLYKIITRSRDLYLEELNSNREPDYTAESKQTLEILKKNSADMVHYVSKSMAKTRAISLMEEVGIPEARDRYRQYPFEFSGGMRQRIVIAIALAANPDLLICDEPTTALDVTIQAQILDLINDLKTNRGLSVIFITHDLGVVANVADHIAVMYAGKIVEYGSVDEVFYSPAHPYTWALLASMPDLNTTETLDAIPGTPPNMIHPPKGDAFAQRNKYAMEIDFEEEPPFFDITPTHRAATWLLHPDAPKAEPPKIVTERIKRMQLMEDENG